MMIRSLRARVTHQRRNHFLIRSLYPIDTTTSFRIAPTNPHCGALLACRFTSTKRKKRDLPNVREQRTNLHDFRFKRKKQRQSNTRNSVSPPENSKDSTTTTTTRTKENIYKKAFEYMVKQQELSDLLSSQTIQDDSQVIMKVEYPQSFIDFLNQHQMGTSFLTKDFKYDPDLLTKNYATSSATNQETATSLENRHNVPDDETSQQQPNESLFRELKEQLEVSDPEVRRFRPEIFTTLRQHFKLMSVNNTYAHAGETDPAALAERLLARFPAEVHDRLPYISAYLAMKRAKELPPVDPFLKWWNEDEPPPKTFSKKQTQAQKEKKIQRQLQQATSKDTPPAKKHYSIRPSRSQLEMDERK
jgi:hypothetical protein